METKKEYKKKIKNIFINEINYSGNENSGLISSISGRIVRNTTDYVFSIPFRLEKYIQKISGWDVPDAAVLTIQEPAKIFGFFTFGEIFTSNLWKKEITPLLLTKRDWFEAAIELLNTMGYGYYSIIRYTEENNITIQVKLEESIEAISYRRWYGKAQIPVCNTSTGLLTSISTLIYKADISSGIEINIDNYEKYFNNINQIKCKEIDCIAQKLSNLKGCTFLIEN